MAEGKLFARFDLDFADNPKIIGLSCEAFRAFVESVLYSRQHLTDGFIDRRVVERKWGTAVALELSTNDSENPSWGEVDGGWQIHGFEDKQTTKAEILAIKQKKRDAAQARWSKTDAKGMHGASVVHSKADAKGMPETETETETETIKEHHHQSTIDGNFDVFWKLYPRKVGKESARKAFVKALKSVNPYVIIAGAERVANDKNLPEQSFIPHAATWLNRGGWDDEPYPVKLAPGIVPASTGVLASDASFYCKKHGYPKYECYKCDEENDNA